MAFPPRFLDELRERLSLVDVIARRVKLQRRGREHVGLCPFHGEKTPSFTVSEDKGFFHCFGCGAHGDAIAFVMRTENLSYPETIEKLAGEAGLPVPQASPGEREQAERAATIHKAVELACAWFEKQLRLPAGKRALDYLEGRGLDAATIARFRLGFAPDQRGALKGALAREGVDEARLVEAGLLKRRDEDGPDAGQTFDYFRGRVMFPITDRRGRVVAFGGRVLGDGTPKYLNSPETPLFHKGSLLYGLAQAREASRAAGEVLVVEGYMDVIALAQAGLAHVVAPLGTALTEDQLKELWRLAPEPLLCFDGDMAGRRAASRAIERALPLLAPGRSLRLASLPADQDPDSLVRRHGPAGMRGVQEAALPLVDALWHLEAGVRPLDTPERRADFVTRLRGRSAQIQDATVRRLYQNEFEGRLAALFGRGRQGARPYPARPPRRDAPRSPGDRILMGVVAAFINHPELAAELAEPLGRLELPAGDLDRVRQEIINLLGSGHTLDAQGVKAHLSACGLGGAVDSLLSPGVYALARYARPEGSLADARRRVGHVFSTLDRKAVHADARGLVETAGLEAGDDALRRLEAVVREQQSRDDLFADDRAHD